MSSATNETHASPSGADFFPENRIPPAEGDFSPIEEAKALLEGRLTHPTPVIQERIEEFSRPAPEINLAKLAATFPDWKGCALGLVLSDILSDDLIGNDFPRYRHEVLQGQRRTLISLLALAEPKTYGPMEELLRRQEEELRTAFIALGRESRPALPHTPAFGGWADDDTFDPARDLDEKT